PPLTINTNSATSGETYLVSPLPTQTSWEVPYVLGEPTYAIVINRLHIQSIVMLVIAIYEEDMLVRVRVKEVLNCCREVSPVPEVSNLDDDISVTLIPIPEHVSKNFTNVIGIAMKVSNNTDTLSVR